MVMNIKVGIPETISPRGINEMGCGKKFNGKEGFYEIGQG